MQGTKPRPRVYCVKKFAFEIGLSTRTIERMMAAGALKRVQLSPHRIGIPAEELDRLAGQQSVRA